MPQDGRQIIRHLAEKPQVTLAGIEQRVEVAVAALEEARKAAADVGSGHHQKISAIAHFGKRGADPAGILQDAQITQQRVAIRMIDDATASLGEFDQNAHTCNVCSRRNQKRLPGRP